MKNFFIVVLSFVFVVQISGQGFIGRSPFQMPILPAVGPMQPFLPQIGGVAGMAGLHGGRPNFAAAPKWVKDMIGSTYNGKAIVGGQGSFPRHGGAGAGDLFKGGLRDGWGADPLLPMRQSVSGWSDPLGGMGFPTEYAGGDLVLDPSQGHYVAKVSGGVPSAVAPKPGYVGRVRKPKKNTLSAIHDPIALQGGGHLAHKVSNQAARTIDMGSGGAVSRGDPFARDAAQGLAREMVHVAGKQLGLSPHQRHLQPIMPVQPIHHQPIMPIHPRPVKPIMPIHPRPVKPIMPIHPKPVKPIMPIHPKPVKPIMPIHPKPVKPIMPIHPKPVKPIMPIHPKPVKPIMPVHPKPVGPILGGGKMGGLGHLQGGMHGGRLPPWVRRLIGTTLNGQQIIGGQGPFPRHGGAGAGESFKDGTRNGWGGNQHAPVHTAVSSWVDPLDGNMFPTNYAGEELMFDDDAGHYIIKSQTGGIGGLKPVLGGPVGAPIGHQIAKSTGAIGPIGPMGGHLGSPIGHQVVKATGGIGPIGSVGGHLGSPIGHQVAKATGGIGPIGPVGGHLGSPIGHQVAKATGGIGPIGPMGGVMGPAVHPGSHIGHSSLGGPSQAVHNVAKSGVVAARHDPLAVAIGRQSAHHIAGKATHTINKATGGGVARGDPFATQAAHGLAREASAVSNAHLALASGAAAGGHIGGIGGPIGIQHGQSIFGGLPAKPMVPKKKSVHHLPKFPSGYAGRTRKRPVMAATW